MALLDNAEFPKNGFTSQISPGDLTGDRELILPDKDGTIATLSDVPSSIIHEGSSPPSNPSLNQRWLNPGGSPYSDEWIYLQRGGVTGWWSPVKSTSATAVPITFTLSAGSSFPICVASPNFSANQLFVEFTATLLRATATHTTTNYFSVTSGYLSSSAALVGEDSMGNTQNLAQYAYRRLASANGYLPTNNHIGIGIILGSFGGSAQLWGIWTQLFYRILNNV